eukprot:gene12186-8387_t
MSGVSAAATSGDKKLVQKALISISSFMSRLTGASSVARKVSDFCLRGVSSTGCNCKVSICVVCVLVQWREGGGKIQFCRLVLFFND